MSKITFELNGKDYNIPEVLTIGDYIKIFKIKGLFEDEYFSIKLINVITGANLDELMEAPRDKIEYVSSYILHLIPPQQPAFIDKFTLEGIEYGFIPEWKKMSFGEFADLDTLMTKKPDEMFDYLHIITAILYRPIIKSKSKHKFTIEKYNQETMDERSELFKNKLDVEVALGAQFFFIKFAQIYSNYSPMSLTKWMKTSWGQMKFAWRHRKMIWHLLLKRDLDGLQFSIELQRMILQDTLKLLRKQS